MGDVRVTRELDRICGGGRGERQQDENRSQQSTEGSAERHTLLLQLERGDGMSHKTGLGGL